MNKREKYIKASEIIVLNEETYCCYALQLVNKSSRDFERLFHPRQELDHFGYWGYYKKKENQLARSLALLFMAELDK